MDVDGRGWDEHGIGGPDKVSDKASVRLTWPSQRVCGNCLMQTSVDMYGPPFTTASSVLVDDISKEFTTNMAESSSTNKHSPLCFMSACQLITGTTSYCSTCKSCTGLVRKPDVETDSVQHGHVGWIYQLNRAKKIHESLETMKKMNGGRAVENVRKAIKALHRMRSSKQHAKASKHASEQKKSSTKRPLADINGEGKI